jgi:hypothetical protein
LAFVIRTALKFCTVTLLLVCVAATAVLWWRSQRHRDVIFNLRADPAQRVIRSARLMSAGGVAQWMSSVERRSPVAFDARVGTEPSLYNTGWHWWAESVWANRPGDGDPQTYQFWFENDSRPRPNGFEQVLLIRFPYWALGAMFTTYPLWLFCRTMWRRRRVACRIRVGQCPACGYDMRATCAERCPECGSLQSLVGRSAAPPV